MATRRTSDTISKGSANSVKSAVPTAATCAHRRGFSGRRRRGRRQPRFVPAHQQEGEGRAGGGSQRPMGAEAASRRLARQIEQHQKEQIEHQDGARVHDDLHGRQELSANEHEDPCDVQKQRKDPQHAVDGIAARDGQHRARDAGGR